MSQPYQKLVADLKAAIGVALRSQRSAVQNEKALHEIIAKALKDLGLEFTHEHRLSASDRLDFLVRPGIVIEVKKGSAGVAALQQIGGYLDYPETACAVCIAMRWDGSIPKTFRGKPVFAIELWRLLL